MYSTQRPAPRSPHRTGDGLFGRLNREWETHAAAAVPPAWRDGVLGRHATVGQVMSAVAGVSCSRDADSDLHALLTLHAGGCPVAGRAVLQTMLGKVARLARTAHRRGLTDPTATALEAMWRAVSRYPLSRTSAVAANLAMEALAALPQSPRVDEVLFNDEMAADLRHAALDQSSERRDLAAQTLRWALDHRVLTELDTRILVRLYCADPDQAADGRTVAGEFGLSYPALRQRHSRATRALAAAVRSHMDAPSADAQQLLSSSSGAAHPVG